MDINLLERGMKVLVDSECELTRNEHGFDSDMTKTMGTIQTIQDVRKFCNTVIIADFNWSAGDLTLLKKLPRRKKQPTVHFELKDLVI